MFHLEASLDPQRDRKLYCSRKGLKSFCVCLKQSSHFFSTLQNYLLNLTISEWMSFRETESDPLMIMEMQKILENVLNQFKTYVNDHHFNSFEEVSERFLKDLRNM